MPSRTVLLLALALVAAACGPGAPSATPSPSPVVISTPEGAADAVRARVPLLDGIGPADPELVGQSASWTAEPVDGGWRVTFEIGWGDCPAGCIDRHALTWDVAADGSPTFVDETGPPLPEDVLAERQAASTQTGVAGRATGGPTCPVERPGDPSCAPRLVGGVELVVQDPGGAQVARVTTDGSGYYRLALPPGDYVLVPPAVEGFMGNPGPVAFTVRDGAETWVDLGWDTGIR
jgi:hypothetical protein